MFAVIVYVIAGVVFTLCVVAAAWMTWMAFTGRFRLSPGSHSMSGMKQVTCRACRGEGDVLRYDGTVAETCDGCNGAGFRWASRD